ncbi:hypothetical protein PO909_033683 [Leuciscus waleckii]
MNMMDSPTLHLLFRLESRPYLSYLAWLIQNGDLPLTAREPEAPTEVVQEPAPESTQTGQSIAEPGADYNLIDLWSEDPIPTQFPTLSSSSSLVLSGNLPSASLPVILIPSPSPVTTSPLDPSAPLLSRSSSALPPPLTPCGPSSTPQVPGCTSGLQAHTSTSTCQPVAFTSTQHSFIASAVRLP